MATITISGSNAAANRLLTVWGETASTVAEGEAIIKQRTIEWYKGELMGRDKKVHDDSFVFSEPDFT